MIPVSGNFNFKPIFRFTSVDRNARTIKKVDFSTFPSKMKLINCEIVNFYFCLQLFLVDFFNN